MPLPDPPSTSDKTTLVDMDPVSCLCSSQHPTNIMTGVILRLLREHFSRADNIIYDSSFEGKSCLEQLVWTSDSKTTAIQIQPVWAYKVQDVQRRPAIYVKRNEWTTQKLGINEGFTVNASRGLNGEIGRVKGEYQSRMVLGSHTINCVSGEGAMCEDLAGEVFDFMMSFSSVFRSDLKLHKFEVASIGAISEVDESTEHFVVPIVVNYAAAWAWNLNVVAPWFQKLSIDLEPKKC